MFLGLKGALGRNPMLNRVGQKLLQSFGGASAAYSLRNLASNIASVVRVRRASDNSERDFSAEDISSGAMTQWVNGQVVPPLDIRELDSNGERTGSLVAAAAAYSLRNLSTSYTGNVVDVRRSSDDAEDSFTAAEVADGTLTTWVNTNFNVKTYDFSSGAGGLSFPSNITLEGDESIAGVDDALKISVVSTGSTTVHRCYQNITPLGSGSSLRITLKAYRPSSNVNSGKLGFSFASGFLGADIGQQFFSADDTWEDFSFDGVSGSSTRFYLQLSATNGAGSLRSIFNGTTGDHVYIKDLKIDVVNSSGHVTQWYDQSGNANHATQGTDASQPKIVDGGSLIEDANGNPWIDFQNAANGSIGLDLASNIKETNGASSIFVSVKFDEIFAGINDYQNLLFLYNTQRWMVASGSGPVAYKDISISDAGGVTDDYRYVRFPSTLTNHNLMSSIYDGSSTTGGGKPDIQFGENGVSQVGTDGSIGFGVPATGNNSIGYRVDSSNQGCNVKVQELIIYDSDQSDNRTAIEANIGDTYNIDLPSGVDTGYDQVDGFVETWYDQSGNGKDATQQVSGSQPKIVDAGVLVSGGIEFDGVDDIL